MTALTEKQSVAAMRLALDALGDKACPPVLRLAAWRYVYRGEEQTFLGLLREAAARGDAERPSPRTSAKREQGDTA